MSNSGIKTCTNKQKNPLFRQDFLFETVFLFFSDPHFQTFIKFDYNYFHFIQQSYHYRFSLTYPVCVILSSYKLAQILLIFCCRAIFYLYSRLKGDWLSFHVFFNNPIGQTTKRIYSALVYFLIRHY